MKDWKPITARISLFPTSPPLPSVLDLFKKTWNSEPDNFQKPLNPLLPASAKAKRGSLTVGCSVHPQRIDFSITSSTSVDSIMSEGLDLIEDVKRLNQELLAIITMLGKEPVSNSVNRVAFFMQFLAVEPNIVEANKAVMLVIPEPYRIKRIFPPSSGSFCGPVLLNALSEAAFLVFSPA